MDELEAMRETIWIQAELIATLEEQREILLKQIKKLEDYIENSHKNFTICAN